MKNVFLPIKHMENFAVFTYGTECVSSKEFNLSLHLNRHSVVCLLLP